MVPLREVIHLVVIHNCAQVQLTGWLTNFLNGLMLVGCHLLHTPHNIVI